MGMTDFSWRPSEDGATLGQTGSEQGIILRDEEHDLGARITLERDAETAPFAITCGIYGWMLHKRFFGTAEEAQAQYLLMKSSISEILEAADQTADDDGGRQVLMEGVDRFVETFP